MTPPLEPRSCWVLGLALALAGCALDRGQGFARLDAANLEVSLEAEGDSGEAALVTDRGYAIALDRATLRVRRWELQELAGERVSAEEDDHDHGEDDHDHGEAEHEDEQPAAAQPFATLVTLGFDSALSLTAHQAVAADRYDASRELPRSSPERVLVVLERFEVEGTVSGADLGDEAAALVVDLPLDTELAASFEPVAIDQDGPESVHLATEVSVPGTLFDGIDFAALSSQGSVLVDDPDSPAALELATALAASDTHADLD
jgi:hypothetical protein